MQYDGYLCFKGLSIRKRVNYTNLWLMFANFYSPRPSIQYDQTTRVICVNETMRKYKITNIPSQEMHVTFT